MNEFYVLQNEILISVKMLQSHITYYSCKNLPSIQNLYSPNNGSIIK